MHNVNKLVDDHCISVYGRPYNRNDFALYVDSIGLSNPGSKMSIAYAKRIIDIWNDVSSVITNTPSTYHIHVMPVFKYDDMKYMEWSVEHDKAIIASLSMTYPLHQLVSPCYYLTVDDDGFVEPSPNNDYDCDNCITIDTYEQLIRHVTYQHRWYIQDYSYNERLTHKQNILNRSNHPNVAYTVAQYPMVVKHSSYSNFENKTLVIQDFKDCWCHSMYENDSYVTDNIDTNLVFGALPNLEGDNAIVVEFEDSDEFDVSEIGHVTHGVQKPNENFSIEKTNMVYGLEMEMDTYCIRPSESYVSLLKQEYTVHEYDGEILAVEKDHILYIPYVLAPKTLAYHPAYNHVVDLVMTKSGRNLNIDDKTLTAKLATHDPSLIEFTSQLDREKDVFNHVVSQYERYKREYDDILTEIERVRDIDHETFVDDVIEKLSHIDAVETYGFPEDNVFAFVLRPMKCIMRDNDHIPKGKIVLPKILVTVYLDNREVSINSFPTMVNGCVLPPAPHVRGGSPCFGTSGDMINSAIKTYNLPLVVILIIQFLQNANLDDAWGDIAESYPRAD